MDRATIERALRAHGDNVAGTARTLGMHPNTLGYQAKRLGLLTPRPVVIPDQHHVAAALAVELTNLRAQSRAVISSYLPGPHRTAHLRELEVRQREVLARLRGLLGSQPVVGGLRGNRVAGALRPAWGQRW